MKRTFKRAFFLKKFLFAVLVIIFVFLSYYFPFSWVIAFGGLFLVIWAAVSWGWRFGLVLSGAASLILFIPFFIGTFTKMVPCIGYLSPAAYCLSGLLFGLQTEQKQHEEALKKSEVRYRLMMENQLVPLLIMNSEGTIVDLSSALAEMLGYSRDELIGSNIKVFFHPAGINIIEEGLKRLIAAGTLNNETQIIIRDGKTKDIEIYASYLFDNYYLCSCLDITERKEIDRLKDEFVSIVSHELRSPLATINVSLELLDSNFKNVISNLGNKKDECNIIREIELDLQKNLNRFQSIANSVDHMSVLVSELLDVTRIEMGKIVLQKQLTNFSKLVTSVVEDIQVIASQHVLFLEIEENIFFTVDPVRARQIVINLVTNAVKYSPAGGNVYINLFIENNYVILSVKDRGAGIPEEEQDRIFERFYMSQEYKGSEKSGLGLGLYICKQLLELHDGKIWLSSKVGKGSTFYAAFPYR